MRGFPDVGKDWLIIDDLVDTGRTAAEVRSQLPNAHFATLYAKPQGLEYVDSYVEEVSQETWIRFPLGYAIELCRADCEGRVRFKPAFEQRW